MPADHQTRAVLWDVAGMRAIGVRSTHPELSADLVVDTLDDLPDGAFEQLLVKP